MSLKYLASICFLFLVYAAGAQIDTVKSKYGAYYFKGDDVVFEFDLRKYQQGLRGADSTNVDFADLKFVQVAIAGKFNNWSAEGWKMQRVDVYRYRLRKHLKDFKDVPSWDFKFLINGTYWSKPDAGAQGVLGWYDVKNPKAPGPAFGDTGNVVFKLRGYKQAKEVILTGSFNNWDEHAIRMKRVANGWEIHGSLTPGEYEYKFIADGDWTEDIDNPVKRRNQYDTFNSVLQVAKPVHFFLKGYGGAQEVILAGSFNDWSTTFGKMRRTDTGWTYVLSLPRGKHLYKFIVDGQWMTDPANPRDERDKDGNLNSVLMVR